MPMLDMYMSTNFLERRPQMSNTSTIYALALSLGMPTSASPDLRTYLSWANIWKSLRCTGVTLEGESGMVFSRPCGVSEEDQGDKAGNVQSSGTHIGSGLARAVCIATAVGCAARDSCSVFGTPLGSGC